MTATTTNRWKLGLFVMLGFGLMLGALIWIGGARFNRGTERVVTYFDESVQGLDVGSAVKYRGVPIGTVAAIRVSEDQLLIEVACDLFVEELVRLGLDFDRVGGKASVPDTLYAQLASSGLTGIRFVEIGLRSKDTALVKPDFAVNGDFLPAQTSTMTSVESAVKQAALKSGEFGAQLVVAVQQLNDVLTHLNGFVADVSKAALPEQGRALLQSANSVTTSADRLIEGLDRTVGELKLTDLAAATRGTLDELRQTLATAREILERMKNENSPLDSTLTQVKQMVGDLDQAVKDAQIGKVSASFQQTMKNVDGAAGEMTDAARSMVDLRSDLELTLASLREASDSMRSLVEDLRRDPNSLFFGRKPDEVPAENP